MKAYSQDIIDKLPPNIKVDKLENFTHLYGIEIEGEPDLEVYAFKTMPKGNVCAVLVKKEDHMDRIIAVDKYFLEMSRIARATMLFHEVGHVIHKHYSGVRSFEDEIEADSYSVKMIGIDLFLIGLREWIKKVNSCPALKADKQEAIRKLKYWEKAKKNTPGL